MKLLIKLDLLYTSFVRAGRRLNYTCISGHDCVHVQRFVICELAVSLFM